MNLRSVLRNNAALIAILAAALLGSLVYDFLNPGWGSIFYQPPPQVEHPSCLGEVFENFTVTPDYCSNCLMKVIRINESFQLLCKLIY